MRAKSAVLHPGKGHANCGLLGAVCVALVECTHACFRIFGPVDRTLVARLSSGRAGRHCRSQWLRSELKSWDCGAIGLGFVLTGSSWRVRSGGARQAMSPAACQQPVEEVLRAGQPPSWARPSLLGVVLPG